MDIFFKSNRLKRQCSDDRAAQKAFGTQRAKLIRRRLDDLFAAECLEDMRGLPGRLHELTGDQAGVLSLDLDGPYRLLFEAATPSDPEPKAKADWSTVTCVKILGIEDTHG